MNDKTFRRKVKAALAADKATPANLDEILLDLEAHFAVPAVTAQEAHSKAKAKLIAHFTALVPPQAEQSREATLKAIKEQK